VADFAQAGASILTIHQEADRHLQRTLTAIRERGLRAGLALNPGSPVSSIEDLGPDIDLLLVMTVNPGFGGQPFLSSLLHKVARARRWLDDHNLVAELEVDGGIKAENAARLVEAGAQVLVAGSSVFGKGSIAENLAALKRAATVASVI
jgi:ribulose-phosphate 3-epimerase